MKYLFLTLGILLTSIFSYAQDIIYKVDQSEINAKIYEITTSTIKYYENDILKEINISDVFMIIYENGEKEVFKKNDITAKNINATTHYNKIYKSAINIKVVDKRISPTIIGEQPGIIVGTRMKIKDNKNKAFPLIEKRFERQLEINGFNSKDRDSYALVISINELFYDLFDNFTYMQIDQRGSVNVSLVNNEQILYNKDLFSVSSLKQNEVKDYIKRNGYKLTDSGAILLIVIDDIIKQLLNDNEFQNLLN